MLLLLLTVQAADRIEEADTLAMGRVAVASPESNAIISANPGAMGLADRYTFHLAGSYGERGLHWQVGALDTQTSPVSFGLTYSGDRFNPPLKPHELPGWQVPDQTIENRKRNHDIAVGLAVPMLNRRFSAGIGGSVSFFNHDRRGKGFTGNVHAGLGVRPIDELTIGLSARNLLPVPDPGFDRPMEFLGAVRLSKPGIGTFAIEGGARPEHEKPLVLAAGAEVLPRNASLRGGWRLEDGQNHITMGIGGGSEQGRIDLGLLVPTPKIAKPVDWTVQLSLRFKGPNMNDLPEPR